MILLIFLTKTSVITEFFKIIAQFGLIYRPILGLFVVISNYEHQKRFTGRNQKL